MRAPQKAIVMISLVSRLSLAFFGSTSTERTHYINYSVVSGVLRQNYVSSTVMKLRIKVEQRETRLQRCHKIVFVVSYEQTRHLIFE